MGFWPGFPHKIVGRKHGEMDVRSRVQVQIPLCEMPRPAMHQYALALAVQNSGFDGESRIDQPIVFNQSLVMVNYQPSLIIPSGELT